MTEVKPILTKSTINPHVVEAQYAVRGAVPARANEIEDDLKKGKKYPFNKVIYCNIGNPQRLGKKPITYWRQVCSLLMNPDLIQNPSISSIYPSDVIERAKYMLENIPGGLGAYSHSQGIKFILEDVAEFITKRDGYKCDAKSVFLTQGASPGIQSILQVIIRNELDGCLIPVPQYPLYSGTLSLLGGRAVHYSLDERSNWALSIKNMEEAIESAGNFGITVRAIVVINPNNPTAACLPEENILEILRFAKKERIVVLADEVYQTNIYYPETKPFVSFRYVLHKHEDELKGLELFSFNSISKGYMGECGIRGGYMQLENIDPDVHAEILKLASLQLCPNLTGQVMVDLMVKPPAPGSPSYELYEKERSEAIASLSRRAKKLSEALEKLPCCSCCPVVSSMYAFPYIRIPPKAVEEAKKKNESPDQFYAFSLLESTGLCVVPGSGFGEEKGTYHLRTTILPLEEDFDDVVQRFSSHHMKFIEEYGDKEWIEEQEKLKKEQNY